MDHSRQAGSNGTQSEHTVKSITPLQVAASPRLPGRLYAGSSIVSPGQDLPRAISMVQSGTAVVVVDTMLVVTWMVLEVVVGWILVVVDDAMLEVVVRILVDVG